MNLSSKYFDAIRIKSSRPKRQGDRPCAWPGCGGIGEHKAPKSPQRLREYHWFCLEHVRQYNNSWNFFSGMSDEEIAHYHEANVIGHRPTWSVGLNPWARAAAARESSRAHAAAREQASRTGGMFTGQWFQDMFGLFEEGTAWRGGKATGQAGRRLKNGELKALRKLGLDEDATAHNIKSRYKELVKRHHPDANGGDKEAENRLREVIAAYQYLKSCDFL